MYDVHIEVESLVYIYVYVGSRTIFFPVVCLMLCSLQYPALWVTNRNSRSVGTDAEWECPSVSLNKHTHASFCVKSQFLKKQPSL